MESSPFAMFRRNQRGMMVVITALAIFSFIFLDSFSSRNNAQLPLLLWMLLVAMFCAGGLWVVGAPRGKGMEWASWGAVIGAVVAFISVQAGGPPPAIRTANRAFTREQLARMSSHRSIANQFLARATANAGVPAMRDYGTTRDRDLVSRQEWIDRANASGIIISDEAVTAEINRMTSDKLTEKGFRDALKSISVSETQLFDALRDELKVRQVLELEAPWAAYSSLHTPESLWRDFRRLKVKQELAYTAIPTAAFTEGVAAPTDAEVAAYFEKYSKNEPRPGLPGFLQPRRVQLAYLVADFESFEKLAAEPTADEVQARYESLKETRFRQMKPAKPKQDPAQPAAEAAPSTEAPAAPANDAPTATEKPATEPPAEAAPKPEAPAAAPEAPATEPPAAENTIGDAEMVASFLIGQAETPAAETPAAETPAAETPAAETPAKDAPATEPPAAATPPAEAPAAAATTEPAAATKTETIESAVPTLKLGTIPPPKTGESDVEFGYQELTDELKAELRDELLKQRAIALMATAADKANELMASLADEISLKTDPKEIETLGFAAAEKLKAFATANNLVYEETGKLTREELTAGGPREVGLAVVKTPGEALMFSRTRVVDDAFSSKRLFSARRADAVKGEPVFAWWKVADVDPEPPLLTDPGVTEKVMTALKLEKARPLAEKRANELLDVLKAAGKPLSDALTGQTVLGTAESTALEAKTTPPFSWLTQPLFAPRTNFNPPAPRLSNIPGIEGVSEEFMAKVFEATGNGEFAVQPNQDGSMFYVVQVQNRDGAGTTPGDELAQKSLRQEFRKTQFFSASMLGDNTAYSFLDNSRRMQLQNNWYQAMSRKQGLDVNLVTEGEQ